MKHSQIIIKPFKNKGLFNGESLFDDEVVVNRMKINQACYISSLSVVSGLMNRNDYPLKKKNYCIKKILDFLAEVDIKLNSIKDSPEKYILPIGTTELISHFSRDTYKKFLKILEDEEIIKAVPYENGNYYRYSNEKNDKTYTKRYCVLQSYLKKTDFALIWIDDFDRKKDRRFHVHKNLKVPAKYKKTLKKLEINIADAVKAELEHCYHMGINDHRMKIRISRIFYTTQKRFIKKGKKVDRIYHSFTNVSKVARRFYNIDFTGIDVVNCQPLLLALYLRKNDMPVDDKYVQDCENGHMYEQFEGLKGMDRNKVKVAIYKYLFFGWKTTTQINKYFRHLYPNCWKSLSTIHQNKDFSLASVLQNTEASIFNRLVPKKSKFYFTQFDAIYFSDLQDSANLQAEIIEHFANQNIRVTLEVKDIKSVPPKKMGKKVLEWSFEKGEVNTIKRAA
ncbi:hypothetical protein [Marixanthomonas spongiae]|uniref:Uncharacterized protein n=1 Tax=Marixanthomonas spongiae TaxID=2174845 RepID=A0A2U0HU87_9FLAO|nr:hypothetical protein [Marixanthomonas spongiae]PVW12418.1 hypothetical protein DDV96_15005 [Marixanthomonas spongiae]